MKVFSFSKTKTLITFMFIDIAVSSTVKSIVAGGNAASLTSSWLAVTAMIYLNLSEGNNPNEQIDEPKNRVLLMLISSVAAIFICLSVFQHLTDNRATFIEIGIMLSCDIAFFAVFIYWLLKSISAYRHTSK